MTDLQRLAEKILALEPTLDWDRTIDLQSKIESLLREAMEHNHVWSECKECHNVFEDGYSKGENVSLLRAAEVARKYKADYVSTRSAHDETIAYTAEAIAAAIERLRDAK